jgi:hypothetical protein
VFEPAFADLRDVPGGLAYGALLSVERTALPALRSIDGVLDREESTVKALTYDGYDIASPTLSPPSVNREVRSGGVRRWVANAVLGVQQTPRRRGVRQSCGR